MPCTYAVARDEIQMIINIAWLAGSAAIVGSVPLIVWPEMDTGEAIDPAGYYARVHIANVATGQASLACQLSGADLKRYRSHGVLAFEIRGPKGEVDAPGKLRALGVLIQSALRKNTANVIFRDVTLKEFPFSDGRARLFLASSYCFDEIE